MEDSEMDRAAIWDDTSTFDGFPYRKKVNIITSGYPCQPFSSAGKRGGETDSRYIWPDIARIISEVRPSLVFIENVSGHLIQGFDRTLAEFASLGFDAEWDTFRASDCGASQRRKRLFCLAMVNSESTRDRRLHKGPRPERIGEAEFDQSGKTVGDRPCFGLEGNGPSRKSKSKKHAQEELSIRSGVGLFPPTRDDIEAWRKVLEQSPDLKPAIHRVADGPSHRLDEDIRLCGNAVVPVVAALAFTTLWERLKS